MKAFFRFLIGLVLVLALGVAGLCWYFSSQIIFPNRKAPDLQSEWISQTRSLDPQRFPLPEKFEVSGVDEAPIVGWYFAQVTPANCAVVMGHGWGESRSQPLKWADILWDCGCDVVTYDHRGHGDSGGEHGTGGFKESYDLVRVTEWLERKTGLPRERIAWFGVSWGAGTSLQAGAREDIAFIIADSPFQDWETAVMERAERMYGGWVNYIKDWVMSLAAWRAGVDYHQASALTGAADIQAPVLIIHSKTDEATASFQSVNLDKALNPERHVFHHLDWGAGHIGDLDARPEEYRNLVLQFVHDKVGSFGVCGPEELPEIDPEIMDNFFEEINRQ